MANLTEEVLYEGVSVDIAFGEPRPSFGDLYMICGKVHPRFPPSGRFAFDSLADLRFEQVDDYFGVRALNDEGTDVSVWMYPLIAGEPVHHHPGPFDGIRLDYSILRNPAHNAEHYLNCVQRLATFGSRVRYRSRKVDLEMPPNLSTVRGDIDEVVRQWSTNGIVVGSMDALEIDF